MAVAVVQNDLVRAALEYAGYGWRVVPLHNLVDGGKACSCRAGSKCEKKNRGKHPRLGAWQKLASNDEERIVEWWEKWPEANVGIALGEGSNLVDFEYDSDEERLVFDRLFKDVMPPTPVFQSSRGKHHLFHWRNDLPGDATKNVGGLVIRIGNNAAGAQSVFPPSIHPTGKPYLWLVPPSECSVADIPEEVMVRIWNWDANETAKDAGIVGGSGKPAKTQSDWQKILDGTSEGNRNQSLASYIGKILRATENLNEEGIIEIHMESARHVNEKNTPPLVEEELRKTFISILKAEQNRRTTVNYGDALRDPPEVQIDKEKQLRGMRVVIVRSDPPMYELHAKQFSKADGGCLRLTAEQYVSARNMRVEALKQADYVLPKAFSATWEGTAKVPGLCETLILYAEERDAPTETKRNAVIAERILEKLSKARNLEEGQEPDRRRPSRLPDGSIAFKFTTIWEELSQGADKITRLELSRVLEAAGVKWYRDRSFKRLSPEGLEDLRKVGELTRETPTTTAKPLATTKNGPSDDEEKQRTYE